MVTLKPRARHDHLQGLTVCDAKARRPKQASGHWSWRWADLGATVAMIAILGAIATVIGFSFGLGLDLYRALTNLFTPLSN